MINLKSSGASWLCFATLLCVAAVTAGCATTGENLSMNDGDQLLQEAQGALKTGAKLRAQKLFEDASKTNPADKKPWIKLAQLHFDEGNYAQAITAGQEVLARDAKDQEARSIVLVSSLRVAAKSLAEMRDLNQFTGDARTEAKRVASMLRENLGEEILVPDINAGNEAEEKKTVEAKHKPRPKPRIVSAPPRSSENGAVRGSSAQPVAVTPSSSSGGGRSDPFGSLR